jgi:hypothetical protein
MLSREENDLITRVGPGTPMGELMRRYWIPALLSEEISEPDCRHYACDFWVKILSPFVIAWDEQGFWLSIARTAALRSITGGMKSAV